MAPLQKDVTKDQSIQTSVHHSRELNRLGPLDVEPPLDNPHWSVLQKVLETPLNKPRTRDKAFSLACTIYNLRILEAPLVNAHHLKLDFRTRKTHVVVEVVQVKLHRCLWTTGCCKTVKSQELTIGC